MKPSVRPQRPHFSSGPCAKRPGWSLDALSGALLGRSHRAKAPKQRLQAVIERSKALLGMPADWKLGIVPASDTGAIEMAMWSLLGERPVDVLAWESFGQEWVTDVTKQLKLDARVLDAPLRRAARSRAGRLRARRDLHLERHHLRRARAERRLDPRRSRRASCSATPPPRCSRWTCAWPKLDVVTWSWQKVLGGEAAHGMLALSPRAVARLESFTPPRPLPKIFRLTKKGRLDAAIFEGATINTPSMLCVEDALDGLAWAEQVGGLRGLIARSESNLAAIPLGSRRRRGSSSSRAIRRRARAPRSAS